MSGKLSLMVKTSTNPNKNVAEILNHEENAKFSMSLSSKRSRFVRESAASKVPDVGITKTRRMSGKIFYLRKKKAEREVLMCFDLV